MSADGDLMTVEFLSRRRTRSWLWLGIAVSLVTGGMAAVGARAFVPVWAVVMAGSQGLISLASP